MRTRRTPPAGATTRAWPVGEECLHLDEILNQVWGFLSASWDRFSMLDRILLIINVLVLLLARPLINRIGGEGSGKSHKLAMLRVGTLLIILFLLFYNIVLPAEEHTFVTRVLGVVLVAYVGYLAASLSNRLIKRRFGRKREINGETMISETYNSRLLGIIAAVLIFALVLVAIVQILGFEDLLHAGGVIGVIGLMLALTQSSWAPDLISGLIILNSRLMEEGDVVEISDGEEILALVFRTKMFHTELLDVSRNHRIMVQNAKLRGSTIKNLSKFASARGLREQLEFNIGYDVEPKAVRWIFEEAFAGLQENGDCQIEFQRGFDLFPVAAANFAVTWAFFYYTKDLRHLVTTRCRIVAEIVRAAREHSVQLATPMLVSATTPVFNGMAGPLPVASTEKALDVSAAGS